MITLDQAIEIGKANYRPGKARDSFTGDMDNVKIKPNKEIEAAKRFNSIMAGGPGSGRHEGYGKFKRSTGKDELSDYYEHKASGTKVSISDSYGPGGKTTVRENGKVVHRTSADDNGNSFTKKRYGIDQEKN